MKKIVLFLAAVAVGAVVFAQVGGDPVIVETSDPSVKQVEVTNFPDQTRLVKTAVD